MIYVGVLGGAAAVGACGGEPTISDIGEGGATTAPPSDTGTPTSTPTATATPNPCGCDTLPGTSTGLNKSAIALNSAAYHAGTQVMICRDANGYYAMRGTCTHQGTVLPAPANLSSGITCSNPGGHGATFNANGDVTGQPTGGGMATSLPHYKMGIAGDGTIYVDTASILTDRTCRCT